MSLADFTCKDCGHPITQCACVAFAAPSAEAATENRGASQLVGSDAVVGHLDELQRQVAEAKAYMGDCHALERAATLNAEKARGAFFRAEARYKSALERPNGKGEPTPPLAPDHSKPCENP